MTRWRTSISFLSVSVLLAISVFMPRVLQDRPVHRYILVFDISQSMNVEDVSDQGESLSRLAMAGKAARTLLAELPCGSSLGLSIFAGARTILLLKPLEVCEHYEGLLASLESIDGRMRFDNASSVGKGLHQSLRAAKDSGDETSVIFFSDGHEAPPLREGQQGLPRSEKLGIEGMLVGLGGETPVRIPKTDLQGRQIGFWQATDVVQRTPGPGVNSREELSFRNEAHLKLLASLSGFSYATLNDSQALVRDIKASGLARTEKIPVDMRWVPALLALMVLCLQFVKWPSRSRASHAMSR